MSNFVEIKDKDGVPLGQLPVSKEGGRMRNIVYITSTDDYEKPAWLKFVIVRGVGGGGGGGGCAGTSATQYSNGGGGGGGGYFEKMILAASIAPSETVTVGAAGAGGLAGLNNGENGGTTSFGAHCSATGGTGGQAGPAETSGNAGVPGVGGVGTGGDINVSGQTPPRAFGNQSINLLTAGPGGASMLASNVLVQVNPDNGPNASGFGGGGGGGACNRSSVARAGGNGAHGICIVEEYE